MIGYTTPLTGDELNRYLNNRERAKASRRPAVILPVPWKTPEERQERLDVVTEQLRLKTLARTGQSKMW